MTGEFVKVKYFLLFVSFSCISIRYSSAQFSCPANPVGGTTEPLVCQVPFSILNFNPTGNPSIGSAATQSSLPINGSIAAQLTQLPVPSGSSGSITLKEAGNPSGETFNDLEPVLTERPETIGFHHLYAGFTYQHFNFNALDGNSLAGINFGFSSTSSPLTYYGTSTSNVSFKLDQSVALLSFGATRTTDISVVIPISSVSVTQTPTVLPLITVYNSLKTNYSTTSNGVTYTYVPGYNSIPSTNSLDSVSGSASGIGDLKFGVKQLLYGQSPANGEGGPNLAVAAGFNFRIPSGDPLNFLGSGAYGADLYGLVSYRSFRSPFSPHFKIGKLWNGPSPLLNPDGKGNVRLPGGMEFGAGTDYTKKILGKRVTVSVDVIGNQFTNAPTLHTSTLNLNPSPPTPITFAQVSNETYTAINFSGGLKFNPTHQLLIYGNVLVQLNNVGLRSDPVPLGGISYNFDLRKKQRPQP